MTPQELKALLAETTKGPWEADAFNNVWSNAPGRHSKVANLFARPQADGYDKIPDDEVAANARLIAMAPALARRVIAAEKLAEALRVTREKLASIAHSEFDGVWSEDDFAKETKEADQALSEWEAAQ